MRIFGFGLALALLVGTELAAEEPAQMLPPFRVGVSLPLSGPLAHAGQSILDGIALATEKFPGIVTLIVEDDQYQAKQAIGAVNKLLDRNNVNAMVVFGGPPSVAVAPILRQRRVPSVALTAAVSLDEATPGTLTRVWESSRSMGAVIDACLQAMGPEARAALVTLENDATIAIRDDLKQRKVSLVLDELVPTGEQDLSTLLLKARRASSSVIISNLLAGQHRTLIRRARETQFSGAIILNSSIFFDTTVRPPYPEDLDGIYATMVDDRAARDFYGKLRERGKESSAVFMAVTAYDAATHLFRALERQRDISTKGLTDSFIGVLGEYRQVSPRAFEPPTMLGRFQNGAVQVASCKPDTST